MATECCTPPSSPISPRFRGVLWIALAVNLAMFGVEIMGGVVADSVSLLADAVDFFGDAANYALTLSVLALAPVWRSRAALIKGFTMGSYGALILVKVGWSAVSGTTPVPLTMGIIGLTALVANLSVAMLLYAFRNGDANMRSVWLCSRNDAIGNLAVMLAAFGVFGTGTAWPDFAVAAAMGLLSLITGYKVVAHAKKELDAVCAAAAFEISNYQSHIASRNKLL